MTTGFLIGGHLLGAAVALAVSLWIVSNEEERPDIFDAVMIAITSALWPVTLVVIASSFALDCWKKWVSRG
ncbi:hypothetical protein [Cedecea sp.]|jgi:hypothetical protein|uniref:hypothetical protein n=1 Tax=Cedecea sp. TaxID=1970739 RepID=UPI002F3FCFAC